MALRLETLSKTYSSEVLFVSVTIRPALLRGDEIMRAIDEIRLSVNNPRAGEKEASDKYPGGYGRSIMTVNVRSSGYSTLLLLWRPERYSGISKDRAFWFGKACRHFALIQHRQGVRGKGQARRVPGLPGKGSQGVRQDPQGRWQPGMGGLKLRLQQGNFPP